MHKTRYAMGTAYQVAVLLLLLSFVALSACTASRNESAGDSVVASDSAGNASNVVASDSAGNTSNVVVHDSAVTATNPPAVADPLSILAPDTARGVIHVVGSEPVTSVVLRNGEKTFAITGISTQQLRPLSNVEVVIYGRQTSEIDYAAAPQGAPKFVTDSFVVRAADGRSAHDGVILRSNGQLQLRLTDGGGVHAIVDPPAAVRELVGARVFLVGPLSAPPLAWGIIQR